MSLEGFVWAGLFLGVGATLVMDLWALFVKRAFAIPSLNYCFVGRWLCHMRNGRFAHESIATAEKRPLECVVGWVSHYGIGVIFAWIFLWIISPDWLQNPIWLPALLFGVATVIVPFFVMQPAFGLGVMGAKTPQPTQTRFRSLMAHTSFGIGLYVAGAVFFWLGA